MKNIWKVNKTNIWNFKQNHPELVIKDIRKYLPIPIISGYIQRLVRVSMMARGINKWLKVRRDLIAYKKLVKHDVKREWENVNRLKKEMSENYCYEKQVKNGEKTLRQFTNYQKLLTQYLVHKELLKYKEYNRHCLKKLCMTERWQEWESKKIDEMNDIRASD